ncbi:MAG: DUF6089 family protein [Bacteroidota bacterium]
MRQAILVIAVLFSCTLHAQHLEVGLMLGGSNYEGDLAPSSVFDKLGATRVAFGGFARFNFNNYLAARLSANYAGVTADDSNASNVNSVRRNLNFKSNILEFGLTAEINILGYQPYNLERVFSPYLFAGIALYRFNPKTEFQGQTIELQPIGTEGQGLPQFPEREFYSLTQFSIPFGGGLKYALNDAWNIGVEIGLRKTFTDYLDDVSTTYVGDAEMLEARGELAAALSNRSGEPVMAGATRGNPDVQDWYIIGGVTVSYNFLDNGLVGFRRKSGKNTGCPTF